MLALWPVCLLITALAVNCIQHDFKGFDDSILFGLNWPGPNTDLDNLAEGKIDNHLNNHEVIQVTTSNKEKYECHLPKLVSKEPTNIEDYTGLSPLQLLKPLFSQKICSYRLESYWSYEVCHGRFIRQYHEDREGKKVKLQEYFLGRWSKEKQQELDGAMLALQGRGDKPKTTKIDGMTLPYVELEMDDGTVCDLSGKPRLSKVQYVCYSHGKHEVYSFKEISTCEYEILILSPLLCAHPQYKPQETGENSISCMPVGDAPKKPRSLLALEADSLKMHHQTPRLTLSDRDRAKDVVAVLKVEKIEKDGETHLKFELHPLEDEGAQETSPNRKPEAIDFQPAKTLADDSPVRAFLNGENCLNGGAGWWKYEFCYGKSVEQYHVDRAGVRTSVLLGKFDEKAHLEWIKENKVKAPKPVEYRTSISHFYSGGDMCDKTGKPRQTEVKLKCLENSSSVGQVSLYLLEPRTCHYILGVESPLICDILPLADETGMVKMSKPLIRIGTATSEQDDGEEGETNQDQQLLDPNFAND